METIIFLAVGVVALVFTALARRSRTLPICLSSSLLWLVVFLWAFLSPTFTYLHWERTYMVILGWVLIFIIWIPLIDYVTHENKVEIRMNSGGKSWSEWRPRPGSEPQTAAERRAAHRKMLRRRLRR